MHLALRPHESSSAQENPALSPQHLLYIHLNNVCVYAQSTARSTYQRWHSRLIRIVRLLGRASESLRISSARVNKGGGAEPMTIVLYINKIVLIKLVAAQGVCASARERENAVRVVFIIQRRATYDDDDESCSLVCN
jgi:hypothetical protein